VEQKQKHKAGTQKMDSIMILMCAEGRAIFSGHKIGRARCPLVHCGEKYHCINSHNLHNAFLNFFTGPLKPSQASYSGISGCCMDVEGGSEF
jgi:hypothetical protein